MKHKKRDIITVVDIGTTKICTVIAEKKLNEKGDFFFQILGYATTKSEGMLKGSVNEMSRASQSISKSLLMAKKNAQVNPVNIHIGISGTHIKSQNFIGKLNLTASSKDKQREITSEDIKLVIDDAKRVAKYQPDFANLNIIHAVPHYFITDNGKGIANPLGMESSSLKAYVHVIFANETIINSIIRCFKISGYNVNPKNIILEPIASAHAVLNKDQKDLGAIMIDIGGGTTDVAVYYHNSIRYSAIFPYGGYELTRKLSEFIQASPNTAEKLKLQYGQALIGSVSPDDEIEFSDITGKRTTLYKKVHFISHIYNEMGKLIHRIFRHLDDNIRINHLRAGVYLTGGTSNLKYIDQLVVDLTKFSCIVCNPDLSKFRGNTAPLEKPEFSTAIGIFLYVLDRDIKKGIINDDLNQEGSFWKKALKFIVNWFV